jgi:formiminotetrahydrofolate cyclodeaminase
MMAVKKWIESDAATAVHMAHAAIEAAGMNVRVNVAGLADKDSAQRQVEELKALQAGASALTKSILAEVEKRATLA